MAQHIYWLNVDSKVEGDVGILVGLFTGQCKLSSDKLEIFFYYYKQFLLNKKALPTKQLYSMLLVN